MVRGDDGDDGPRQRDSTACTVQYVWAVLKSMTIMYDSHHTRKELPL
jgi:hypothetical protein